MKTMANLPGKRDLGLNHYLEGTGALAVVWHQNRVNGFPCGYRVFLLADDLDDTGWLRCPTCGDLGRIVEGRWNDESVIPTSLRDHDLVLAIPV